MRLLVIRTSAMGDVALLTPVLKGMREQYPDVELVLLTRPAFRPFFSSLEGLNIFSADFKIRHKGIAGIYKLFNDIKKSGEIDYVLDLHDVLRSKILRFIFRMNGIPVKVIDKGRKGKRLLIKGTKKEKLTHSSERYLNVFAKAGFNVTFSRGPWISPTPEALTNVSKIAGISGNLLVGVAPFAKHDLKMWPEEYMVTLLRMISEKSNARFVLFGGREEADKLLAFQGKVAGSVSMAGKLSLEEELALMTRLNFMIAMDSSNMHMAALTGTKVISIWGATDPLAGFGPFGQPDEYCIRIPVNKLTCRPCTVYGKGKCRRGDHACMNWLTPETVLQKLYELKILIEK